MAHAIESRANIPANRLRDALDRAERLIVNVNQDTVEELLVLFDQIEQMFEELSASSIDLRPEEVRWQSLQNRIFSRPLPIVRAANRAGGMRSLRAKHPPANAAWWKLDGLVVERRRKSTIRLIATILILVGIAGGLYWGVNTLFPPDPDAVLMVDTTAQVDRFVMNQQWEEALALVDQTLELLPDEPELWIWKSVLHEQLGEADAAAEARTEAQRTLADQPAQFWILLGTTRFQVGDIAGAEDAGNQAIVVDPDEPQAYLLLGGVAEAQGDVPTAIEMFDRTYELAEFSNPELAVIARVRLGQLLQQPRFSNDPATPTPAATPSP